MYYNFPSFSTLLYALRFSFLRKSKLVARNQGRCAEKASAQLFRIADFGLRIFLVFFFNPHS
jgi:hypothetical protein